MCKKRWQGVTKEGKCTRGLLFLNQYPQKGVVLKAWCLRGPFGGLELLIMCPEWTLASQSLFFIFWLMMQVDFPLHYCHDELPSTKVQRRNHIVLNWTI